MAARNIMISHDLKQVKIIDFGMSRTHKEGATTTSNTISIRWSAPEIFTANGGKIVYNTQTVNGVLLNSYMKEV